jgi:type III pantothenate kinase
LDQKGQGWPIQLMSAAKVKIIRYVKIRSAVNPYDPKWELYLEARLGWQLTQTRTGRSRMESLWKRQKGRCLACGQPLRIAEEDCQIHHRDWRTRGGSEMADNTELLHANCHRQIHVQERRTEAGIKTGMPVLVDNPAELGADRLVNAIAAYERYGGPCVVVDFGTATTFDVISVRGEYLGGAIAPGLGISADALFSRAARLGRVDIKRPAKVIGTNTVTHLQTGLYYGYIGLVDGILERIVAELGAQPRVIATGGLARQISEDSRYIAEIDDMLTLDGLLILFERNRTAKPRGKAH